MIWGRGTSETLGGSLVHSLHCPTLRWWCTSRWRWLEEIKHWNPERQRQLLLFQNVLTASNHPHNFLSSCCSLLVRIFKHLDNGFGKFKPISSLQIRHVSFIRLKLRLRVRLRLRFFSCFFRSVLLRISTSSWCVNSLSWEFSNPNTYSSSSVPISALGWGQKM